MLHSNKELIRHIADEIAFVLEATKGKSKEQFLLDPTLTRATIRSLEIIGEATKKINPEFRNKYKEIDWRSLAGTRDKLIHEYFGIDYNLVWDIIRMELPMLSIQVERILSEN